MTHGISLVTGLVVITCRFSLVTKASELQTLTREVFYCKLIKTIAISSMMVVESLPIVIIGIVVVMSTFATTQTCVGGVEEA